MAAPTILLIGTADTKSDELLYLRERMQFAGATVHQVTAELDVGPILEQAVVPVLPDDTAQTLAARVLVQEHAIYPRAIAKWLSTP